MKYRHIRNQLNCYLHQDFDLDSNTVPEAIFRAIKESNIPELLGELNELKLESDDTVFEVLNDHGVDVWQRVTPREVLTTMMVLAELFEEERQIALQNHSTEQGTGDNFTALPASP